MNPLQSRKQMLSSESDLNRAQLLDGLVLLTSDVRAMASRQRFLGSIVSSAAVLVAGVAALRIGKRANPGAKRSWMATALKGAGFASSVWLAFRCRSRDRTRT